MYKIKSHKSIISGERMYSVIAGNSTIITFNNLKDAKNWINNQG